MHEPLPAEKLLPGGSLGSALAASSHAFSPMHEPLPTLKLPLRPADAHALLPLQEPSPALKLPLSVPAWVHAPSPVQEPAPMVAPLPRSSHAPNVWVGALLQDPGSPG